MAKWLAPRATLATRGRWPGHCARRMARSPGIAWWEQAGTSSCRAPPEWNSDCGSRTKALHFAVNAFTCGCTSFDLRRERSGAENSSGSRTSGLSAVTVAVFAGYGVNERVEILFYARQPGV